jgi:hypothetical protein
MKLCQGVHVQPCDFHLCSLHSAHANLTIDLQLHTLLLHTTQLADKAELINNTKLCHGVVIQPLAPLGTGEEQIAIVDVSRDGDSPVRCPRCMAYVNPFFRFIGTGDQVG